MVGGDLHWLWKPYELYGNVDYVSTPNTRASRRDFTLQRLQVYGVKAYENGEGFAGAAGTNYLSSI